VFSSILDYSVKEKLARKSYSMLIDGGCFIWYDFKYDNPFNADVKGISKSEVRRLFTDAVRIDFTNVTLAPPISRKIPKLYALVNFLFPFLRTHFVAVVHKD